MKKKQIIDLIEAEIKECNACIQAKTEHFTPDSCLMRYQEHHITKLGIIMKGNALLYCIDQYGNRNILEYLDAGSVFGEFFAFSNAAYSFEIQAVTECEVMYLNYDFIIHRCQRNCEHHANIVSILFQIMAMKSTELQQHLDIIGQRNIRTKLIKYFEYLMSETNNRNGKIEIPVSWTELSDYLCVERTSMMREISNMEKDGIILNRNRSKFRFLHEL